MRFLSFLKADSNAFGKKYLTGSIYRQTVILFEIKKYKLNRFYIN